jgi:hypothetical protein
MMGIMVFYEGDGRIAGDIGKRHWRQMRRILPVLVEWLNEHLRKPPKGYPATLTLAPFKLSAMLKDDADKAEEVNLLGLDEWKRFFAWCEVLDAVDDTYKFFAPTVEVFREQSRHPDELRQA